MFLKTLCYNCATWRVNPKELINRAIHSNEPKYFGEQKHRVHEVILFFTRLGLRPITLAALRYSYKSTGYSPIGFGYFTTALLKEERVLKIYEFSTRNSEYDQKMLVGSLRERLEIAQRYIRPYLADTTVDIIPHPISGKNCVALTQAHVDGKPLTKRPYAKYLTPPQKENFAKLLEQARTMLDETEYLLDVNGHNMIARNDSVVVVDTILMGKVDVKMRPITLKILNSEVDYLKR